MWVNYALWGSIALNITLIGFFIYLIAAPDRDEEERQASLDELDHV